MKNGGGGGGGRGRAQQNDYGDRTYTQQTYSGPAQGQTQGSGLQAQAAPPAGGEDPYAACKSLFQIFYRFLLTSLDGGYQAYVALWYQAMAAQQVGQPGADPSKPPGTS